LNPAPFNDVTHPRRSRSFKPFILTSVIVIVLWVGLTAAWNTRIMQQRMTCSSHLEKIGIAISTYLADHPEGTITLNGLVELARIEKPDLVCPSVRDGRSNYALVSRPRGDGGPVGHVLAYEPLSNHGQGANVLFADGKCKFVPKERLGELGLPEG
jgi:prepilin-type processing-associated H-X9-DG protein